jgi:uncharacterized membrane protein YqgA involved in biofilm formation
MLGAMQGMMHIDSGTIVSGKSMLVVLCFTIGIIVGELIGIENGFEKFGEWLKKKTGNSGDKQFVEAHDMRYSPPRTHDKKSVKG